MFLPKSFKTISFSAIAMAFAIVVVPPTDLPHIVDLSGLNASFSHTPSGKVTRLDLISQVSVTINLPSAASASIVEVLSARASSSIALLSVESVSEVEALMARGSTAINLLAISSTSEVGKLLATGQHDVSDEELASMIMALLYA